MFSLLMTLEVISFAVALWLGLYLIGRDPRSPRLLLTGLGLVAYAMGIGSEMVGRLAPGVLALWLGRVRWVLLWLPLLCWAGATIHLLPERVAWREPLRRGWRLAAGPLCLLLAVGSLWQGGPLPAPSRAGSLLSLAGVGVATGLVIWLLWQGARTIQPRPLAGVILTVTLFFGLGLGMLVLPRMWLPREWVALMIGGDLLLLGLAVARFDAFDQGEALLPDLVRSFDAALLAALLLGGQVGLAMVLVGQVTWPLVALLVGVIATAIAMQVFAAPLRGVVDRVAFARAPELRAARAELVETAEALPRANPDLDLLAMDEGEWARHTRRAFSHFGDLGRLATNPLAGMPVVAARLQAQGRRDDALERATELKSLLTESVLRLKPRTDGAFGTADEWRHYNALFFPYVVGLKPYSSRASHEALDPAAERALDWFRTTVPERTLRNWQNAAARLVALELQARCAENGHGNGHQG